MFQKNTSQISCIISLRGLCFFTCKCYSCFKISDQIFSFCNIFYCSLTPLVAHLTQYTSRIYLFSKKNTKHKLLWLLFFFVLCFFFHCDFVLPWCLHFYRKHSPLLDSFQIFLVVQNIIFLGRSVSSVLFNSLIGVGVSQQQEYHLKTNSVFHQTIPTVGHNQKLEYFLFYISVVCTS